MHNRGSQLVSASSRRDKSFGTRCCIAAASAEMLALLWSRANDHAPTAVLEHSLGAVICKGMINVLARQWARRARRATRTSSRRAAGRCRRRWRRRGCFFASFACAGSARRRRAEGVSTVSWPCACADARRSSAPLSCRRRTVVYEGNLRARDKRTVTP